MSLHNYEYKHSKYNLGITELYWETRHGEYNINDFMNKDDYYLSINGFIFMQRIHPIQFLKYYENYILRILDYYYQNVFFNYLTHNDNIIHHNLKNFEYIVSNRNNYKVDIVQKIQLEGDFAPTIAIIKTHYLRLIQRKWKNIYRKRQEVIQLRKRIQSLQYREINGRWPHYCYHLPTIKTH